MPPAPPNFLWRKRARSQWLEANESRLQVATAGTHSVVEQLGRAQVSVEVFCATRRAAEQLKGEFGGAIEELPADWQAQFFAAHRTKPLRIGKRLWVMGDATELGPTAPHSALIIPAGAAFGTGEHATTAMSLRLLERISRGRTAGWRMLDAGTGSGVLALAGKRFGAGPVLAIDNDRTAISTARENARTNAITGVKFIVGDVQRDLAAGTFDIITANLYSELLESVLSRFRASLAPAGALILSGVLRAQEPKLTRALRTNEFRVVEARRRGKWIALLASSLLSPAPDPDLARDR
ncbi:MAG: 50S ribosomal protein L11 methyltransferase [Chthoniobacterales bacterium]